MPPSSFSKDMRHVISMGVYSDITCFLEEEKIYVKAHRAILASRCDYFKTIFECGFKEQGKVSDTNPRIGIPSVLIQPSSRIGWNFLLLISNRLSPYWSSFTLERRIWTPITLLTSWRPQIASSWTIWKRNARWCWRSHSTKRIATTWWRRARGSRHLDWRESARSGRLVWRESVHSLSDASQRTTTTFVSWTNKRASHKV